MRAAAANLDFEKAGGAPRRHQAPAQPRAGLAAAGAEGLTAACCRSSNDWLKKAALEVQEYVRLRRRGVPRRRSRRPFYRYDIVEQFDAIGVGSLTVVLLTGFFTGAVLALAERPDARSVRRAAGRRPAGQRVDDQGARAGADRR